jgi:hypothetical protein
VYSLPVSALCSGCRFTYEMEANIKALKDMKELSQKRMQKLENYAEPYAGLIVENYKRVFK